VHAADAAAADAAVQALQAAIALAPVGTVVTPRPVVLDVIETITSGT
jgi:hypothetical protein